MGFLTPSPPPFELEEWKPKPHLPRLKPLVQDWGLNGFGSPAVRLPPLRGQARRLHARRALRDLADAGARQPFDFGDWWTEPIVFQKFAAWTLLWEILGLGAGSMPLSFRFVPPIGGPALLAAPGHDSPAALARQGAADQGLPAHRCSTSCSTPACSPSGSSCSFAAGVDAAGDSAGRLPPEGIAVLLACWSCSACATRSPSSAPARRSTRRCSRSASSRWTSGSSPGSSSSSSSGGAPPPRS